MKTLKRLFRLCFAVLMLVLLPGQAFLSLAPKVALGAISAHTKQIRFFDHLGQKESSGDYTKVNKFGYLGKYQFGEQALATLGYYTVDGSKQNDWRGKWSGKSGVFSKQDFLNNKFAQEVAVRELTAFHWAIAVSQGMDKVVGKELHGIKITKEGLLAAMHLVGPKSVKDFLLSGVSTTDGFGTTVRQYLTKFSAL